MIHGNEVRYIVIMATELTKTKRKRTTKNIVLNNLLPLCKYLVAGAKTDEKIEEAIVLLQSLKEASIEVRVWSRKFPI